MDTSPVGYLKVNYDYSEKSSALEVERIYFHQSYKGLGLGRKLMEFAFELAQKQGKESVILKAMDSSKDAIGFYHKMGFQQIGTFILHDFELMKPEFRRMVILEYFL
jgi:ribosomal protein S18 acetylase RimI-like enzyme